MLFPSWRINLPVTIRGTPLWRFQYESFQENLECVWPHEWKFSWFSNTLLPYERAFQRYHGFLLGITDLLRNSLLEIPSNFFGQASENFRQRLTWFLESRFAAAVKNLNSKNMIAFDQSSTWFSRVKILLLQFRQKLQTKLRSYIGRNCTFLPREKTITVEN